LCTCSPYCWVWCSYLGSSRPQWLLGLKGFSVNLWGKLVLNWISPVNPITMDGPVASQLDLVERRRISGIKFLNSLLRGNFDSPYLLSLICLRVPQRHSWSVAPFYFPFFSTNYLKMSLYMYDDKCQYWSFVSSMPIIYCLANNLLLYHNLNN